MYKYADILKWAEERAQKVYAKPHLGVASTPDTPPARVEGSAETPKFTPYKEERRPIFSTRPAAKVLADTPNLRGVSLSLGGPVPKDVTNTNEYVQPGQFATIAFSGAHPGETYRSIHDHMPHGVAQYRYNDRHLAIQQIKDMYAKGVRHFRLLGHSRGGYAADRTAAWIQKHYPDATVDTHLVDPVVDSWLKNFSPSSSRLKSKGAHVWMPSKPHTAWYDGGLDISNAVAMLGGRMNLGNAGSVETYEGTHDSNGDQNTLFRQLALFGTRKPDADDWAWLKNEYKDLVPDWHAEHYPISLPAEYYDTEPVVAQNADSKPAVAQNTAPKTYGYIPRGH